MDTNKLLKNLYGGRYNFGEIARYANEVAKTTKSERKVLEAVNLAFGNPVINMLDMPVPGNVYLPEAMDAETLASNSLALDQIKMAARLPVSRFWALMADAHKGYSLPIGGVVALENAVSPAFVGYDIGCRMHFTALKGVSIVDIRANKNLWLEKILKSTSFGLGSEGNNYDHPVMHRDEWESIEWLKNNKALAYSQLGSSGSGNHFANLMSCNSTRMNQVLVPNEFVGLMTHSGSRGIGNRAGHYYAELAERETKSRGYNVASGYGFLLMDTDAGREYWQVMSVLGEYARANHEIIHANFLKAAGAGELFSYDNHHNFAWLENGLYVHRKGATPAGKGVVGIIPGSSGTASYIVVGLGNKNSLNSASHGAGRVHSRTEAKKRYNDMEFKRHMKKNNILYYGVSPDETYSAYKDIEAVMSAQKHLVTPIAKMYPEITVMGGEQKSDDGD